MEDQRINNLKRSLEKLKKKEQKMLFFLPSMGNTPSGGIGVVYKFVKLLNESGYNAIVVHEKNDYVKPTWIGDGYDKIEHLSLEGGKLTVSPEDFFIIPEGFANVMQQTLNLPCKRVVLAQSWVYILSSLAPGQTWSELGITDCIAVNDTLGQYIKDLFKDVDVTVCRPSIPSIFNSPTKPKKPIIAISSRDQMLTNVIIKQFYIKFPQFKWVSFKDMHGLSREDFAETLKECCLGVWVDRISGFGTFPIECAKTNTPYIGLLPDLMPEFASENSGIWTNEVINIPNLIGAFFKTYLEDSIPQEIFDGINEMALKYTEEEEKTNVEQTFSSLATDRIIEINSVIMEHEKALLNNQQYQQQMKIAKDLADIEAKYSKTEDKEEVKEEVK